MEASNGQRREGRICAEVSVRVLVSGESYAEIGEKLDRLAQGIDPAQTGVDYAHMVGFNRRPCPGGLDPYEMEKRARYAGEDMAEPMPEQGVPRF